MEDPVFVKYKEANFEPKIGMLFPNEDKAYKFYKSYAKLKGFTVRRHQYRRLADGSIRKRLFVCSREGFRRTRDANEVRKVERTETRTGCPAMIMFTIEKDHWTICQFVSEHNHDLEKPEYEEGLRRKRDDDEAEDDIVIEITDEEDVHTFCVEEASGAQDGGGSLKSDIDNYVDIKKIRTLEAGDAQGVMDHFKHMQVENPTFFYAMQVDCESRLTNFFWTDGRSKIDYDYFGDVVIFDTSYRIRKYNMACGLFLAVNHHRQNVVLGCSFLLVETTESFVWLFETFLKAMGKLQPRTIFTDQSQVMAKAVEKVFPEARHRLGLWQVCENAAKHIGHYYGKPRFRSYFDHCILGCESEQEFEEKWDELLKEYDLLDNRWLKELHKLRTKWCSALSQDYFSAGIESTQSSENLNSQFRKVTSRTMPLTKFLVQYEKVVERVRWSELSEDICCNQDASPMIDEVSGIVKQAATSYTNSMFQLFHEELCECLSLLVEEISNDGIVYTYKLIKDGDKKESFIKFNASSCMVECSCKKFESEGLLCRHSLRVYSAHNIFQLPSEYILKRWTRFAKDGLLVEHNAKTTVEKAKKPIGIMMSQVMHKAVQLATKASLTDTTTKMAEEILERGILTLESALKQLKAEDAPFVKEMETTSDDDVGDKDTLPSSSGEVPALNTPKVRLRRLTTSSAGLKARMKKRKKNKSQVGTPSNNASTSKQPQTKKVNQGKSMAAQVVNHVNILPKSPIVSTQPFFLATVPGVFPYGVQGSSPRLIAHFSLRDNQTPQAFPDADLNRQLAPFIQGSFPSWIGHSLQNPQNPQTNTQTTAQTCHEANSNSQLP